MQSIGCFRVPKTLTFKTMLRIVIFISMALHFNKPGTETTRKLPISNLFTIQLADGSTNVHVSKKPTGEPEFSIQLRISCTFGNKWITSSLLFWRQTIVNATLRKYSSAAACTTAASSESQGQSARSAEKAPATKVFNPTNCPWVSKDGTTAKYKFDDS